MTTQVSQGRHFSIPRRIAVVALLFVLAALGGALGTMKGTPNARAADAKPTIVLVHGAWADGSGFAEVTRRLQADGYTVMAPPNPLRSLSGDSTYIRSFLDGIKGPVVLVGHSYGGMVTTDAATGASNVQALVYIDAFVPDEGDSALSLASQFPGSKLGEQSLLPSLYPTADGSMQPELFIRPDQYWDVFANDLPQTMTDVMAVSQRPVTPAALGEPSGTPAWKTIPSWYLIGTDDNAIPVAAQRFMAQRAGSNVTEVKASHASYVSDPSAVTQVIEAAATATH